ncbi:hypothetical protein BAY61_05615 [Prauserella marina]|uniref:Steroid 5-alpha reductase family enzyme n=1 Tax=Prauserella marina TaxID=530584 RepID=A0A222VL44_9PSEU|nr:DUF1295 domain-containing protein [Prauserella marina]ASR34552.1 hypothetical protein BAY61_05615 [Prauserella marina]PWV85834.1 steroid 5-alpha reductase family enzyme [Prauserella marina]SDC44369.1 Steroid 5-alpha reductase family enzyme [Prauserella marina]
MSVTDVLGAVALALGAASAVVVAAFVVALVRRRYDTIDSFWGAGFAVIAVTGFLAEPRGLGSSLVVTALTVCWGTRLSWHIHRRNVAGGEDRRYTEMLGRAKRYPRLRMFCKVYLTQGAVMWFVALPVVLAQRQADELGALAFAGIAVWAFGFAFEVIGDEQLRRFKADPGNKGAVLRHGLWRYTRHPNYFGDACVWWGIYLIAAQHLPGVATVLSPVLMTWLLARGSGKPLMERHLAASKGGYADYVRRTSGFVPLPPKF